MSWATTRLRPAWATSTLPACSRVLASPPPPDAELLARLKRAGVTLTELPTRAEDGTVRHHAKVELAGRTLAEVAAVLAEVETLRSLDVGGNGLRDIEALARLTRIEALDLSKNPFDSVFALRFMKRLRRLDLHETNVDDIGALASAAWLEWLDLSGIPVNVADLVKIHELPLRWLDVRGTKIYGDAEYIELKELFPDAKIQYE